MATNRAIDLERLEHAIKVSGGRTNGAAVTRALGVVLCDQARTVDVRSTFSKIEKAPAALVGETLDALRSMLE